MLKWKQTACAAVAVILMLCVVGCSTPAVAISVGDRDYSTGEYLAYLYSTADTIYGYYANYGDPSTMWEQELPYSNPYSRETAEADKKKDSETSDTSDTSEAETTENNVKTAEYIRQAAKDNIVYMATIEALMKENGITLSDEDKAAAEKDLEARTEADCLKLGFSLDNYKKMYVANNYNETALLMGLYGKDGKKPVPEKDLRKYFDDNYLTYEIIQIALVDGEGNALAKEEEAKVRNRINSYMNVYLETGDFDKAIEAYDKDASNEDAGKETVTLYDKTVENLTSNTSDNVQEIDATTADEDLVKAIRSVDEGDVEIVEYKQGGTSNMVALLYRIDPDGKGRENRFAELSETLIKAAKEDEFKEMVWNKMDELADKVVVNQRAIDMCKPENFFES